MTATPIPKKNFLAGLLLCLGLSAAFCAPIFDAPGNWGIEDWDLHLFWHEAARRSIVVHGQPPLWDPWSFGGTPLLAHPESRVLQPGFLLVLACGTVIGIKLEIWLHLALALGGMTLLARRLGLTGAAAWLPGLVFTGCTMTPLQLAAGHTWHLAAAWLPWVVLFYLEGLERPRRAVLAGAGLALMVTGGGVYPAPHAALLLVLLAAGVSLRDRSLAPWRALFVVALFAAALSGVKLLPCLELLRQAPRPTAARELGGMSLLDGLYRIFLDPDQQLTARHGQQWGWWEYGAYIGVLPLVLGAIGLAAAGRRHWPLALAGALFFAAGLAGWGPLQAPWSWLHRLPVFSQHHVPSRLHSVAVFVWALFCGFGLAMLQLRTQRRQYAPLLLLVAVAADLAWVGRPIWRAAFTIEPKPMVRRERFRQTPGQPVRTPLLPPFMLPALLAGEGVVRSESEVHLVPRAVPAGDPRYRGEVYLADAPGAAELVRWSPNKLTVAVAAYAPGALVVNQNYSKDWWVIGRKVRPHDGLLSVQADQRDSELVFFYLPLSYLLGASITLLALAAAIHILCRAGPPCPT